MSIKKEQFRYEHLFASAKNLEDIKSLRYKNEKKNFDYIFDCFAN